MARDKIFHFLQKPPKCHSKYFLALLVSLLLSQSICSSFATDKFQHLYNEDELLGKSFAFSSLEHIVMKGASPSWPNNIDIVMFLSSKSCYKSYVVS